MKQKTILLTFDIEEFDLPLEYKQQINEEKKFEISRKGAETILRLIKKYKVKATFFVTASFAKKYPSLIREISKSNEIAFHGYSHGDNYNKIKGRQAFQRLNNGKKEVEKIIGRKLYGFRAPRFQIDDISMLKSLGFKYDSSLNPTFVPGKYNNFFSKRRVSVKQGIIEIPLSVTPLFRISLFWISFRNLGLKFAKICSELCSIDQDYIMLLSHPWEFYNLSGFRLPLYITRNSGDNLAKILEGYIRWCLAKGYEFKTISEYLKSKTPLK